MIKQIIQEARLKKDSNISFNHDTDEDSGLVEFGIYLGKRQILAFDVNETQAPSSFEKGVGGVWIDGQDSYDAIVKTRDLIMALEDMAHALKRI